MTNDDRKGWAWRVGSVDRTTEHFELRYGSSDKAGWDDWLPVALVGPPSERVFVVEFLIEEKLAPQHPKIIRQVQEELDFYLVNLGERDPWAYAQYHCGTASNVYSDIHWSYFPKLRQ